MSQLDHLSEKSSYNKNMLFFFFVFILFSAVIFAYANHFYNGFHFDDSHTIENNAFIKNIHNIPLFFKDGSTFSSLPSHQSYRPIVSATLAMDYFLGNGNIFFFHLSTFVIFLLQGALIFFFFDKILQQGCAASAQHAESNKFVALAAVALYMLHPANAETINYIIARGDSFSTFFIILGFVVYCCWDFGKRFYLYLIPFILACLTKPIGGIFAPLLILYIYLFEANQYQGFAKARYVIKKSLPALITCIVVMVFIKMMDPPSWQAGGFSTFKYAITQPFVMMHYFITFFLPTSLSADTDWKILQSVLDIRLLIGLAFIAILLFAAIEAAKSTQTKPITFGIFWFFITLIPTSLIPLAEVMNDHRMFLPFVGLTLSVCWTAYLLLEKMKHLFNAKKTFAFGLMIATFVTLSAYAHGTWMRNKVWLNEETLWFDVTQKSPANPRGLMNYGLTLMARGDYLDAGQFFMRALQLAPNYSTLLINLGVLNQAEKLPIVAESYFKRAMLIDPNVPDSHYYYGRFLEKQNRTHEAIEQLTKVLQLAKANLNARHDLMHIYFDHNEPEKLYQMAEQTLQIAQEDDEANAFLKLVRSKR